MMEAAAEIARLREINAKVAPIPWKSGPNNGGELCVYPAPDGFPICKFLDIVKPKINEENAAYIAAFDPPTTRALLDAAAALEQARKEIERHPANIDAIRNAKDADLREMRDQRDAAQQDAKEARALRRALIEIFHYAQSLYDEWVMDRVRLALPDLGLESSPDV